MIYMYKINIEFDENTPDEQLMEYYKTLKFLKHKIIEINRFVNCKAARKKASEIYGKKSDKCDICNCTFIRAGRSNHLKSKKHLKNSNLVLIKPEDILYDNLQQLLK